ncbi:NAD(P)H-dependent oxidoreductase [Nanoarchaeota archaeon]
MKKILIVLGHPRKKSFCNALSEEYEKGAKEAGASVKRLDLTKLKFDPILRLDGKQELEKDLIKSQKLIKWADHVVLVYPTWWFTYPALLKGWIDRTFMPDFAYRFHKSGLWDKLLKGRSARLIVTMDAPPLMYRFLFKAPGHNSIKKGTLEFCGVKPVRIFNVGSVKRSTEEKRLKWLSKAKELGKRMI